MLTNRLLILCVLASLLALSACGSDYNIDFFASDGDSLDGDHASADGDAPDGDHESADGDVPDGDTDGDKDSDRDDDRDDDTDGDFTDDEAGDCAEALPLHCGDSLNHSSLVQGRPDQWWGYACTARLESGPEVIYKLTTEANCRATLRLKDLQVDLDLFRLAACDPWTCSTASSTPLDIQDGETIVFDTEAGGSDWVVVDGYNEAAGSYTIEVDCFCDTDGDTDNCDGPDEPLRNCQDAGGFCNDYSNFCSMGSTREDNLLCDLGVCCLPMTCAEAGATCFSEACPEGWGVPRFGDSFTCSDDDVCCVKIEECRAYLSSLAQCPYQYHAGTLDWPSCPDIMLCLDEPCRSDTDCILMDSAQLGGTCVTGNCVYCWDDSQCSELTVCRGGRCVHRGTNPCPPPPPCNEDGCSLVEVSETSCTVCVCDTIFDDTCDTDAFCQPMAHQYFQRCVYGRCAECRNDDDCEAGQECLPPGLCYTMCDHPSALYGSWLIGWWGALNHYSYFRFEPDGTLRRGSYEAEVEWMDDIFLGACYPAQDFPHPLIGTWEPEVTQSGHFIIRVDFNAWCPDSSYPLARFQVEAGADWISLTSIDHPESMILQGRRIDPNLCTPDFATCPPPVYP